MEMRRAALPKWRQYALRKERRRRADRIVLTLYWATCGYGQRASRALLWLAAMLALATVGLASMGLAHPGWSTSERLGTAALVALEGAAFRTSVSELTFAGRWIHALLRFFGPTLIVLAGVSIRGRVKR
jgi:hypothetical protein